MKIKASEILGFFSYAIKPTPQAKELLNYELDEMEIAQCFGLALKTVRKIKGVSLAKMKKEIDIPSQTINRYENGINIPTIPQAIKIVTYFDLNIELFIFLGLAGLKEGEKAIEQLYNEYVNIINTTKILNKQFSILKK